jgi:hypothetical protein
MPPILGLKPVAESASSNSKLLDTILRQFAQPFPVRLLRLQLDGNIQIAQPVNIGSKVR